MGLAVSNDNSVVFVAGGQENKVFIFDLKTGEKKGFIDCAVHNSESDYSHGYIGDMVLSKDGKTLYAVDQMGFRMMIIDVENQIIVHNIGVGRYPFGICLSPDESNIFVANAGMFEYKPIPGITDRYMVEEALKFPAFAYGSQEMIEGIHNDTLDIPDLGEMNSPESFSVFTISLKDKNKPKVIAKTKTGHLVDDIVEGIPAVGGASPNSLVATDKYVFVSNATNDNISVISM